MANLFKNLIGTVKSKFYIGGPKAGFIEFVSDKFRFRNNADDDFLNVRLKNIPNSGSTDFDAVALMDLQGRVADISAGFAGASPPGVVNGTFIFCHTSGGSFTAGRVYYGLNAVWTLMPQIVTSHISTRAAISGSVSLEANAIYAFESGSWVKKGRGIDRGFRCIAVTFNDASTYPVSSTTQVPAGNVVARTVLNITEAFDAGCEFAISIDSTIPITLLNSASDDFDVEEINQYDNDMVAVPATLGAIKIVQSGTTPTTGEATVYVMFGESES